LLPVTNHPWDLPPDQAIALQRELARQLRFEPLQQPVKIIAGIDVSVKAGTARAAIVVLDYASLTKIETAIAIAPVSYPYIPGLLTFREAPTVFDALSQLSHAPDVLMFDGQGYAHPRRLGLASHIGLLLDRPAIGCAKSRLYGSFEEPPLTRGTYTYLMHDQEILGAAVRTRTNVSPVFVSAGHRIRLAEAIALVLGCTRRYRLPEPTRLAHHISKRGDLP
jgi:deoxyribonuclease V